MAHSREPDSGLNNPIEGISFIQCPVCKLTARVDFYKKPIDTRRLLAPEGFRKFQPGWNSDIVLLYCVHCGVPAIELPVDTGRIN
jgi:hypothetical protein